MTETYLTTKTLELLNKLDDPKSKDIPTLEDFRKNLDLIGEIATFCRTTPVFIREEQKARDFSKDMDFAYLYAHLITKIANAPLQIHADVALMMFMPILEEKIKEALK